MRKSTKITKEIVISEADDLAVVLENGQAQEFFLRHGDQLVGDIVWGQVDAVVPGIEAAFVNIGQDRNGFIHVADLPSAQVPRKYGPPKKPTIKVRDRILVQIAKAPTGNKGARLTGRLTIPGRFLVLVPHDNRVSISRRITDNNERERLRRVTLELKDPGHGLIVRTEAIGRSEEELRQDIDELIEIWGDILHQVQIVEPPALLHRDSDLIHRVLRDALTADVTKIVVDSPVGYQKAREILEGWMPELADVVVLHKGAQSIMERYKIGEELDAAISPKVWLPSGGYLVIEHTEALTVIDVNSGRLTQSKSLAETVLRTNLEAGNEIARQLRLRDIGGIIVIDFISMDEPKERQKVFTSFMESMKEDKSRPQVTNFSEHGLIEVSRRRQGQNLLEQLTIPCDTCGGTGRKKASHLLTEGDLVATGKTSRASRYQEEAEEIMDDLDEEELGEDAAAGAGDESADSGPRRRRRRRRGGRGDEAGVGPILTNAGDELEMEVEEEVLDFGGGAAVAEPARAERSDRGPARGRGEGRAPRDEGRAPRGEGRAPREEVRAPRGEGRGDRPARIERPAPLPVERDEDDDDMFGGVEEVSLGEGFGPSEPSDRPSGDRAPRPSDRGGRDRGGDRGPRREGGGDRGGADRGGADRGGADRGGRGGGRGGFGGGFGSSESRPGFGEFSRDRFADGQRDRFGDAGQTFGGGERPAGDRGGRGGGGRDRGGFGDRPASSGDRPASGGDRGGFRDRGDRPAASGGGFGGRDRNDRDRAPRDRGSFGDRPAAAISTEPSVPLTVSAPAPRVRRVERQTGAVVPVSVAPVAAQTAEAAPTRTRTTTPVSEAPAARQAEKPTRTAAGKAQPTPETREETGVAAVLVTKKRGGARPDFDALLGGGDDAPAPKPAAKKVEPKPAALATKVEAAPARRPAAPRSATTTDAPAAVEAAPVKAAKPAATKPAAAKPAAAKVEKAAPAAKPAAAKVEKVEAPAKVTKAPAKAAAAPKAENPAADPAPAAAKAPAKATKPAAAKAEKPAAEKPAAKAPAAKKPAAKAK